MSYMRIIKTNALRRIFFFLLIAFAMSCKSDLKTNLRPEGIDIRITDSTITINNQQLFFEDSLHVWESALGKYNRKSDEIGIGVGYIWDSLGIQIATDNIGFKTGWSRDLVRELDIYFLGLDSPEAKTGKFDGAKNYNFHTYKDSLDTLKGFLKQYEGYLSTSQMTQEEVIKKADEFWTWTKENRKPQNYLYPYRNFKGKLYVNGIEITANKHLKDLNKERWDNGNNLFRYIDNSSSWYGKNKTGETEKIYDIYYYLAQPTKMSENHPIWYELKYFEEKLLFVSVKLVPPEKASQFIEFQKQ